jgi:hypothetical protein
MRKEDSRIVYEQYWQHARHVENELLTFTSFYAVIVAGSFIFLNPNSGIESTIVMIFVMFLSIFGFFFNYNLRIPFIKFILKAELIAIKELGLKDEYRRYFDIKGKLFKDKFIDTYDIFALLFIAVTTFSFYMILTNIFSLAICIPFGLFHFLHRKDLSRIKETIENHYIL